MVAPTRTDSTTTSSSADKRWTVAQAPIVSTDPVFSMENYLRRKGIETEQHRQQIVATFNRELELAIRFLDQ